MGTADGRFEGLQSGKATTGKARHGPHDCRSVHGEHGGKSNIGARPPKSGPPEAGTFCLLPGHPFSMSSRVRREAASFQLLGALPPMAVKLQFLECSDVVKQGGGGVR
jgi:hypothetical protein